MDYLQQLGINAIELLPVHEFNELEYYQVYVFYSPRHHNTLQYELRSAHAGVNWLEGY